MNTKHVLEGVVALGTLAAAFGWQAPAADIEWPAEVFHDQAAALRRAVAALACGSVTDEQKGAFRPFLNFDEYGDDHRAMTCDVALQICCYIASLEAFKPWPAGADPSQDVIGERVYPQDILDSILRRVRSH